MSTQPKCKYKTDFSDITRDNEDEKNVNVMPTQKKNERVDFSINNDRWKKLSLKKGIEIKCTYMMKKNGKVVVDNIEYPPLYQEQLKLCDQALIAEVCPYSKKSEEKIKVTFKPNCVTGEKLRAGDLLTFQLRFSISKKEWEPVNVNIVEKMNRRQIGDIPSTLPMQKKGESYCRVNEWLKNPMQAKKKKKKNYTYLCCTDYKSWEEWKDPEVAKMGLTLAMLSQNAKINDNEDTKEGEIKWYKKKIQFTLAKHIIEQCIEIPCQVPQLLMQQLTPSEQSKTTESNDNNEFHELTKLYNFVNEFHKQTENMCPQLRQQCRDIVIEENLIERETQAGLIIFGSCPTYKNFKIVKLYVYLPEMQDDDKKHVLVLFPSIEKGVAYRMKLVCNETQSLYFACFAMPENTTWIACVQWGDLQSSPEISSRSCAYFVELKKSQSISSFFNYSSAKQKSPY
ncbi:hypothetical protein RFI_24492, partial [Reticulomyxa filosa]